MFDLGTVRNAVLCLAALLATYVLYGQTVGRLADYPQLDAGELPPDRASRAPELAEEHEPRESEIAAMRGLGPYCDELNAALILESRKGLDPSVRGRGIGVYVFAHNYEIVKEDARRVRLYPFSMVHITAGRTSQEDQIDTVRGRQAVLEFDQPIDLTQLSSCTPRAGWVEGQVELTHNRKTVGEHGDDLVLHTEKLFYDESLNMVWADDAIRLTTEDQSLVITGSGMELEVRPPHAKEAKGSDPSGLKARLIRLLEGVRFDFEIDKGAHLFGRREGASSEAGPVPVTITSQGPFLFDLEQDRASFERRVRVIRSTSALAEGLPTYDQLECDRFELSFERERGTEESTGAAGKFVLRTATASGEQVILLSDAERLQATGNYLYYDTATHSTVLRGKTEMIAVKDDTVIHARELLIEPGPEADIRNLVADGPDGWLEVLDPSKAGQGPPKMRMRWQGRLTLASKPGSQQQLATVSGNVEMDDPRGALRCEQLKAWLVPLEGPQAAESSARRRWEPIKIEASGNVAFHSKELDLVARQQLILDVIHRRSAQPDPRQGADLPPDGSEGVSDPRPDRRAVTADPRPDRRAVNTDPRPDGRQAPNATRARPSAPPTVVGSPASPSPTLSPTPSAPSEDGLTRSAGEPERPLDVRAERIAIVVERRGTKTHPIKAWAEGNVLVVQMPAVPGQEPTEVRGQNVQLEREPAGDRLKVEGSAARPGLIHNPDFTLSSPGRIDIDQAANRIHVTGPGELGMETHADAPRREQDPSDPPQPMRIEWSRAMSFDGQTAVFEEGAHAERGDSDIRCRTLTAHFDRPIPLRRRDDRQEGTRPRERAEGPRPSERTEGPRPRIRQVDCEGDVMVHQGEHDQDRLLRFTTLRAAKVHYDHPAGQAVASGPGVLTIIERNSPAPDPPEVNRAPNHPFQFTRASFLGRMEGNQATRTVRFDQRVRILSAPLETPDQRVDEQDPPPSGLAIEAQDSAAMGLRDCEGRTVRDFHAHGNVRVHAREYWAQADDLKYDGRKDLLVFEGTNDRKALLYRQARPGEKPEEFSAKSIWYWRASGAIRTERTEGLHQLDLRTE